MELEERHWVGEILTQNRIILEMNKRLIDELAAPMLFCHDDKGGVQKQEE